MTLAVVPSLPEFELVKVNWPSLPGYQQNNTSRAAEAWSNSCHYFLSLPENTSFLFNTTLTQWQNLARIYLGANTDFRTYLETYFEAYEISSPSCSDRLFTGYFEPELSGSPHKSDKFCHPIYKKPNDLIVIEDLGIFRDTLKGHRIAGITKGGELKPAPSRQMIDQGALENRGLEICWTDDLTALYFMHVQGCGKIAFENGAEIRLSYGGTNGHAYHSLGQEMIRRRLIDMPSSAQEIKQFLKTCSTQLREELFWNNPSYVFFKEINLNKGPIGRLNQPLTAFHSLAVDPRAFSLGMPLWFGCERFAGFMSAQDVGGAIKGLLRGDVFCGTGDKAEAYASNFLEEGRIFVLLPRQKA